MAALSRPKRLRSEEAIAYINLLIDQDMSDISSDDYPDYFEFGYFEAFPQSVMKSIN